MGYDLTNTYYGTLSEESKSNIEKHWFNVGSTNSSSDLSTTINKEKAYKWQGNIGLLNVSDYIRASNNASCTSEISAINSPYPCKDNNYLFISNVWWIIDKDSLAILSNGSFSSYSASNSIAVRPVLYLKSSIKLKGNGTAGNPYNIVSS
jgi:hypothetical protein